MAWRLARSLDTLSAEIRSKHPGTTIWTIGDQAHASGASDHNPNSAGVVCAIDVLGNAGLNLSSFAEQIRTGRHPQAKYVIFNRRIASRSQGWTWRNYTGSNPHSTHVHVSVGTGSDGKSAPGTYDSTASWGISSNSGGSTTSSGGLMPVKKGDKGEHVAYWQRLLNSSGSYSLALDGDFGNGTANAVQADRRKRGWDNLAASNIRITGAHAAALQVDYFKKQIGTPSAPAPVVAQSWLPKFGDEGPEVQYWQRLLVRLKCLSTANSKYDATMRTALINWFKTISDASYNGNEITSSVAHNLQRAALGQPGPKGDKGDKGDAGEDGRDATVSGHVTVDLQTGNVTGA